MNNDDSLFCKRGWYKYKIQVQVQVYRRMRVVTYIAKIVVTAPTVIFSHTICIGCRTVGTVESQ